MLLACGPLLGCAQSATGQPWEVWDDLHRLPELHAGHQVLLRSSHCPDGCRFDRHSDGDWRYIYVDGDEGVIFEETGAGAITRIWMTMGFGVSEPLNPKIRLRIYVDGAETPVVDLPLPDLFGGKSAPFLPPLVGERLDSSGGNFSYVPIPYREGCRVSLVGAHRERIWFQFGFHRLAEAGDVKTFTGGEDLSGLADLLATQGDSPWPVTETWAEANGEVEPGAPLVLVERAVPGSLTTLRLDALPASWPELELLLTFDGLERVRMPLADFFAVGRGGPLPTRSLLVGVDAEGRLYSYFPMPFRRSMAVALRHLGGKGAPAIAVDYEVGGVASPPPATSGMFGAVLNAVEETEVGVDTPILELTGQGKWIGFFAELGSVATNSRIYLEGDERVFIDGSLHPSVYGTGVEDFFNGGFYFDQGPFSMALHGSPYPQMNVAGEVKSAAYRLMPTDGITFTSGIRAGLEGGPTNNVAMRLRSVAYYYQRPEPGLRLWDVLDVGDAASRAEHDYKVAGPHTFEVLDSLFEGEPPRALTATGAYRAAGTADFVLRGHETSTRYRLRRRFDAGLAGQEAEIHVGGTFVGAVPPAYVNADRRWREVDVDLASAAAEGGELAVSVVGLPAGASGGDGTFTEFTYELWADVASEVFADGFESGDFSGWNLADP